MINYTALMVAEYTDRIAALSQENQQLRRLVNAVRATDHEGLVCDDVDGVNWFDARAELGGNYE